MVATLTNNTTGQTTMRIGPNTIFNDTTFARCQISALASTDAIPFQLRELCGDHAVEKDLQGNLTQVDRIQIIPNPVSKSNDNGATLSFETHGDADLTVDMVDVLGNPVVNLASGVMH